MQEAIKNSILEELIEIAEKKKLSMKIEYTRNGIYIIRDVKGVLPVMVSNDKIHWKLRYHKSGNQCHSLPEDMPSRGTSCIYDYIIPFDRFNPCDIQESLKFNLNDGK